jgi:hypothetical protein
VLKRSIGASLNPVDPPACDGTNTGRRRDKILKRNNLLGHGELPFGMTLSIPIRSPRKGNRKTTVTRRVAIRWATMASKKMSHRIRVRRCIRRRRKVKGSIRNMRATGIMKGKRRHQ